MNVSRLQGKQTLLRLPLLHESLFLLAPFLGRGGLADPIQEYFQIFQDVIKDIL